MSFVSTLMGDLPREHTVLLATHGAMDTARSRDLSVLVSPPATGKLEYTPLQSVPWVYIKNESRTFAG